MSFRSTQQQVNTFLSFPTGAGNAIFPNGRMPGGGKLPLLTNGQKFTLLIPFCAAFASLSLFRAKEKHKARGRNEGYEWFFFAPNKFFPGRHESFSLPLLSLCHHLPGIFSREGEKKKRLCHDTNSFFCQGLLTVGCTHGHRGERRPFPVRSQGFVASSLICILGMLCLIPEATNLLIELILRITICMATFSRHCKSQPTSNPPSPHKHT